MHDETRKQFPRGRAYALSFWTSEDSSPERLKTYIPAESRLPKHACADADIPRRTHPLADKFTADEAMQGGSAQE